MTNCSIKPVQDLLDNFRNQNRVKAGSLIVSVFGDAILPRGGEIWLGSLINLLVPLGLNERLIRTTVFRLVKDEWLTTQTQGRRTDYKLSSSGWRRFEEASKQIYASNAANWDNRWRLVMLVSELVAKDRERLRRAFYWQGFGEINTNCFIHPSADLTTAFDALRVDGMAEVLPNLMPLIAVNPRLGQSANDADIVRSAWDLEQLSANYIEFVKRYKAILDVLRKEKKLKIDDQSAFLTRTLLIHDFRRLLLRDPELPEVLLQAKWPGHTARMVAKELYQRLLSPSENHLNYHLVLANGDIPAASNLVSHRFQPPI